LLRVARSEGRVRRFFHQLKQRLAFHEIYLTRRRRLSRHFIRLATDDRAQSQHFPRFGHFQNQNFAVAGSGRHFHFAGAEHKCAARHLSFDEQQGAAGIGAEMAGPAEGPQDFRRQVAELALSQLAGEATINHFQAIRSIHCHHLVGALPFGSDCVFGRHNIEAGTSPAKVPPQ
jgi:hypothetical protein